MGSLKFEIPHGLGKEKAKGRVEQLLAYWKRKYGIRFQWNGDTAQMSGKVMRIELIASLAVQNNAVTGEATDPGFLLREPARNYLNKKFQTYLRPDFDPAPED